MEEKNWVGLGCEVCPVCGCEHNETVLFDKRLKKSLKRKQAVGYSLCPEHQRLYDEGYIALVEATDGQDGMKVWEARRTGNVAHLRKSVWANVFNSPCPDTAMVFIDPDAFAKLRAMSGEAE